MTAEHILVPTDFSDYANQALDYAIELAKVHQASLTLLHVVAFYYKNRFGARASIHHPYMDEPPFTTDVQVGDYRCRPARR
ncbi:MAG: universal stress protein [Candidatus Tectomicrobia bacterium]|nr:universal stress protein [Candidatus Tectomicrobia bacterium]